MATIQLNKELITQKLNENDFNFVVNLLKNEFKLLSQGQDANPQTKTPTEQSYEILEFLIETVKQKIPNLTDNDIMLANQCFHSLRNCVIHDELDFNLEENTILSNTFEIVKYLLQDSRTVAKECLKKLLQCLCNTINVYKGLSYDSWEKYIPYFEALMKEKDCLTEVIILMNNIFSFFDFATPTELDYLLNLLALYEGHESDVQLVVEKMIAYNAISENFEKLNSKQKIIILDIIIYMLSEQIEGIPDELTSTIACLFKKKSDCILKTVSDYVDTIEPEEVSKLLECLGSLTADDRYLSILQEDKSLLINAVFLLKSIHSAGKENKNYFSPISNLSTLNTQNENVENHPAFGFKANLIRLISNLVCEHKINQDAVRDIEGIQVLLDCCSIDARNPLITQWVIYATRNLCEKNPENQAIIAQMTKVGVVDSATIREMGLVINDDGSNKITVMPYSPKND